MMPLLLDLLLAALAMLALYGFGRALRRLVPLTFWSRSAELAFSFAFGLGAVATMLFVLSLVGGLVSAAGWALLALGGLLALIQYRTLRDDLRAGWGAVRTVWAAPWFVRVVVLIALGVAAVNLVGDLVPPLEGDTVHQYLLVPRYWVEVGRYVQPPHIWAATLPGNMMMISAWALLLNGSYSLAGLMTGFSMSLLFALGVYALARLKYGHEVAWLAAAIMLTVPDVGYLAQSAKVDMGWALFEALALAAFFRWLDADGVDERANHWLVLSGVMLGFAAGSKNQTFISMALLGGWVVIRYLRHGDWRGLLRAAPVFALGAVAAMLPFYLYNGIVHLNPFFPVFAEPLHNLFGATASPRSELGTEVFYPWTVGGYFTNLWNASLGHTRPGWYLGFIAGPVFLLAIPAGLMLGLLRGERTAWRMLGYGFVFSVVWFLVKQAVRHFLPALILLGIVSALVLWKAGKMRGWPGKALRGVAVLLIALNAANILGIVMWNGAYRVVLGVETREQFLDRYHDTLTYPTFPDAATVHYMNDELGPGVRVLSEHTGSSLYIAPDMVSPQWGDRERLDTIDDMGVLLDRLEASRIDYVLVSEADADDNYIFTQPDFLSQHAALVFEGPRTRLYRVIRPEGD